jgi:hypothetical protein
MNSKKLPLSKILINAFLIPWNRKSYFLQAIAIPTLLLVSIWALWVTINPTGILYSYLFFFAYLVAFSYFAITCHRLILTSNTSLRQIQAINIRRLAWFTAWVIVLYALSLIIELIALNILIQFVKMPASVELTEAIINQHQIELQKAKQIIEYTVYLPIMYLLGRLSLVFPATAIDTKSGLKWTWIQTRHNGLRLLFIIALFPWSLDILLSLLDRENATIFEQGIVAILMYLSAAIGIFALSLTYLELQGESRQAIF